MGMNWTEEQQQVIRLRNRNILVSAAAGSGKTAVLVERIIKMITDKEHPLDVDRLLIVTFTDAAAGEMKERIRSALEKELQNNPENPHLQRQSTLIHNAKITTIHSFCVSVIREHFHVIDLDPGFRTAEEGELKLLRQDVLDELFEACYEEKSPGFLSLVEKLGGKRSDKRLGEFILKIYDYSRSYPQPDKWLSLCVERYDVETDNLENSPFAALAKEQAIGYIKDMLVLLTKAEIICNEPDGPYMYVEMLETDMEKLAFIGRSETFKELHERVNRMEWVRLSSKKDVSVSADKKKAVQVLREQAKKMLSQLTSMYFYESMEDMVTDMRKVRDDMLMFTELVKAFGDSFAEKKRRKNIIDFSDMEQFALQILTKKENGVLVPSAYAKEYQEQFAEVMIDEYQDSNLIQEAILTSISTVGEGRYNIFMVGDVKQSIYRFRLSRPELFMEKYDTYSLEDSDRQRIDLHNNFRSRKEVLDCVNYIFRNIMRRELGGIDYDEKAALHPGADYEPSPCVDGVSVNQAELILIEEPGKREKKEAGSTEININERAAEGTGEENSAEISGRKLEAGAVAERIRHLIGTAQVKDKETGKMRKAAYRDIVILIRSIKGWADVFAEVLTEEGIPAFATGREGYFASYEIRILLDFLRVLDNQKQDLPLTAVLTSPFAGLSALQLSDIRMACPEKPFYEAAELYAQTGKEPKLTQFYEMLRHFREKVSYTPIHELICNIIEETGYGIYISAMPGGAQRIANVEMLVEKAAAFEDTSYKGLFNFVRYIEQLQKYEVDYSEANVNDEQADAVRIMSIHKSKGLEFPIVILAGMGKAFNTQDTKSSLVIHPEFGIGMDAIDLERRTKTPTILKRMIQQSVKLENLGEELRVLYVAMTRAKEKLIMTGLCKTKNLEKMADEGGLKIETYDDTDGLFINLLGAGCYMDWVLPSARQNDAPVSLEIWKPNKNQKEKSAEDIGDALAKDVLLHWNTGQVFSDEIRERIEGQLTFRYPYEAARGMKMKFTVSELKKRDYLQEEAGEVVMEEPEIIPLLPHFLQEEEELTGASRGSAYHKFLELLDFGCMYDGTLLKQTIENMRQEKRIAEDVAGCIRTNDILTFLHSEIGIRAAEASRRGQLWKEQPFVIGMKASDIYPEATGEDKILVQGIIDIYFEEDGELVVLDYKTDKVQSSAELAEKYHAQLDYYAKALEQLTGKRVKQKIIYSFALQREIEV